jgi:DNA-binding IclR family transcriptional regulator
MEGRMTTHQATRVENYNKLVPAVAQAIKIINYLGSLPDIQSNLTNIASNVDTSKSKALAILNTLQRFGYVMRNPETKVYSLGLALMTIGSKVMQNFNYGEAAAPLLNELAQRTNSTAMLGIVTGEDQYTIVRQESTWQIPLRPQSNLIHPLSYGAHGKAIVAFLDENNRKRILAGRNLYFHKDPAQLDRKRLDRELEECRISGFARDHETGHPMVKILSSPFFGPNGRPLGAIEIIGLMEDAEIPDKGQQVVETAKRFSRLITDANKET